MSERRCRHRMVCAGPTRTRCADCDELLSLGPSDETAERVAIEVRAAELQPDPRALSWSFYMTDNEHAGWRDEPMEPGFLRNGFQFYEPPAFNEAGYLAGYLARCIATHTEDQ